MYASKARDWPPRTPERVQAAFEGLFHTFGVDLYLCAHKHYYERTRSVFAGARAREKTSRRDSRHGRPRGADSWRSSCQGLAPERPEGRPGPPWRLL